VSGVEFILECHFDRAGVVDQIIWKGTYTECIAACAAKPRCTNIAWVPGSPGPCYLKNELAAGERKSTVWGARRATDQDIASRRQSVIVSSSVDSQPSLPASSTARKTSSSVQRLRASSQDSVAHPSSKLPTRPISQFSSSTLTITTFPHAVTTVRNTATYEINYIQ
jgi:hypothetical protein